MAQPRESIRYHVQRVSNLQYILHLKAFLPSFLCTRVKSRWHSYLVWVYISPIFIYLLGTLIAMYFDHGLPSPGRHTGHTGSPQRKLPRGDGEITYSKPCARSYGKISHVSYGFSSMRGWVELVDMGKYLTFHMVSEPSNSTGDVVDGKKCSCS